MMFAKFLFDVASISLISTSIMVILFSALKYLIIPAVEYCADHIKFLIQYMLLDVLEVKDYKL